MVRKFIFVVLIIAAIKPLSVYAHRPLFSNRNNMSMTKPKVIKDFDISWAIYGRLKSENQIDYYAIDGTKGEKLFCQLLLPKGTDVDKFAPTLVITGPGLPKDDQSPPIEVENNDGYLVLPFQKTEDFFEPFTQTSYIMGREIRIELPSDGRYHIAVLTQDDAQGRYTLAIGEKENWGIKDVFKFPAYWFRTRMWYNPVSTLGILAIPLFLILYKFFPKR